MQELPRLPKVFNLLLSWLSIREFEAIQKVHLKLQEVSSDRPEPFWSLHPFG
jgi:hypothetical protein